MNKKIFDNLKVKGHVKLTVRNPDGSIAQVQEVDNLVVTAGRTVLANGLWNPVAVVRVSHIELGTGTNAPANGDTALQTPSYRNALASGNNVNNIATLTGFFNQTDATSWQNATRYGQMFRFDGSPIYKRFRSKDKERMFEIGIRPGDKKESLKHNQEMLMRAVITVTDLWRERGVSFDIN